MLTLRALLFVVLLAGLLLSGCAGWHYARVQPGDLKGRLLVEWIEPDLFIFTPDEAEPLRFVRQNSKEPIQPGKMYTDGGSIPRAFWVLRSYSPWGYAPAFIVHDWLFEMKHCKLPGYERYDLETAGLVMSEVMKTMMVTKGTPDDLTLYAMHEAVISPAARTAWDTGKCDRPPSPSIEQLRLKLKAGGHSSIQYVIKVP